MVTVNLAVDIYIILGKKSFLSFSGELSSVAPTRQWVICRLKAEAEWDFFLLWPFSV